MRGARTRALAVLAATFLTGAAVGAVATLVWGQRALVRALDAPVDAVRARAMLLRLDAAVDLSAEQREAVKEILARHRPELEALRQRIRPEVREVRVRQWAEVREALAPAQRPAFDRLVAEWEARIAAAEPPDPAR